MPERCVNMNQNFMITIDSKSRKYLTIYTILFIAKMIAILTPQQPPYFLSIILVFTIFQ